MIGSGNIVHSSGVQSAPQETPGLRSRMRLSHEKPCEVGGELSQAFARCSLKETCMRLADFILQNVEPILQQWEDLRVLSVLQLAYYGRRAKPLRGSSH